MPNIKTINNAPSVMVFNKQINDIKLPIHGQGVFLFNTKINGGKDYYFTFYTKDKSDGLKVCLNSTEFLVTRIKNNDKYLQISKKNHQ